MSFQLSPILSFLSCHRYLRTYPFATLCKLLAVDSVGDASMASIARPPESDRPPLHLCSFELLLGWVAAALSTDASASPPAAAAATLLLRVLVVALASPCSVALLRVVASCYELVAQRVGLVPPALIRALIGTTCSRCRANKSKGDWSRFASDRDQDQLIQLKMHVRKVLRTCFFVKKSGSWCICSSASLYVAM